MADLKGKGILYEDDDAPIRLIEHEGAHIIKEFRMSLIGKVLNPKKQNVEKLIQTMPAQWGMQDKITANDLGNGKFLFNFTSEEDINTVLRQGPFHYNFCMFVLVRWEPIVHDDYPWIIPFWVTLVGMPLHLWDDRNLRNIGSRIGHVHTIELTEGRMLIEVDSRKPLRFKRLAQNDKGDEITLEIKYEKLFKHCTSCGLMTHEKPYCPVVTAAPPAAREGVFSRVQPPPEQPKLNRDNGYKDRHMTGDSAAYDRAKESFGSSKWNNRLSYPREAENREPYRQHSTRSTASHRHTDDRHKRVIRRQDERQESRRTSRWTAPYSRQPGFVWREKPNGDRDRDHVPYEQRISDNGTEREATRSRPENQIASARSHVNIDTTVTGNVELPRLQQSFEATADGSSSGKRLASVIVSPEMRTKEKRRHVTVRNKDSGNLIRTLTYPVQRDGEGNQEQIIEALHDVDHTADIDMEMMDSTADVDMEMMESDDLLGDELLALTGVPASSHIEEQAETEANKTSDDDAKGAPRRQQSSRHGSRRSGSSAGRVTKPVFLRRGSPRILATLASSHRSSSAREGTSRQHGHKAKKTQVTSDGSMGSKKPSKHH